tara:strand:- start:1851 stop:2831 length:981 start_codon:yes stop_codon:yes gene_type:complete
MSVILPKQIDVSKLKYSEVKQMKSGAKTVYINYGNEKLTIQTPSLYLPYGISPPYSEKEKKDDQPAEKVIPGSALDVSFRGMDENDKIKQLYNKLKEIENKIVDDAFTNRELWFKDDFDNNKAFCKKLFSPIIKIDKDPNTGKELGKYPPTFKAKIPFDLKTEQCTMDCYDMQNGELDINDVFKRLKGAKVVMIVQLTGLWMAGGKYGCSWKVCTSKFQLSQNVKVTFIKDSDEEEEEEEEEDDIDFLPDDIVVEVSNETLDKKKVTKKKEVEKVEEEEEEEEEDEEEEEEKEEKEEEEEEEETPSVPEPEPELLPPPKKKVTKKK